MTTNGSYGKEQDVVVDGRDKGSEFWLCEKGTRGARLGFGRPRGEWRRDQSPDKTREMLPPGWRMGEVVSRDGWLTRLRLT